MRIHVVLGVALALGANAALARTSSKSPPRKETVALFVITKQGSDAAVVAALDDAFAAVERNVPTTEVLAGAELQKRLKTKPDAAIGACGANLGCIAKLGKAVGASRVVYARTMPNEDGPGIRTQVLVVGVKSKAIENKAMFELGSVAAVESTVSGEAFILCGLGKTGTLSLPGATGEVRVDDKMVGKGPGPYSVAVGRHVVASGGKNERILIVPGVTTKFDVATSTVVAVAKAETGAVAAEPIDDLPLVTLTPEAKNVPSSAPTQEIVAAPILAAGLTQTSTTDARGSSQWTYIGGAVAGIGALALGGGGYLGMSGNALVNSVERSGARGTAQVDAVRIERDANQRYDRANIAYIAGGALLAAGAAIVALDQFVFEASVAPLPGGASAEVGWHF